ncbi:PKD domain-containing protein [Maribellus luteus]|uniref:PKD domain-containing protein n=1 Tax=Maribellus luteus TaxID=2305463 RepID=A0A399SSP2_9BACT|nr:PKD domain-containing protein [Maribellus luteus]RIJ46850.1 PKD domain-containing protein [Maribellus luteus]
MNFRLLLLIAFFGSFGLLSAQETGNPCRRSTEGKEFWFGFMESRNYHNGHYLEVTVTAREKTNITITVGEDANGSNVYSKSLAVNANSSIQIQLPWETVEAIGSEEIQRKGIHLVSEKPVNVYALNWDQNSADVAVIYPVESLGKEYYAMCYEPDIDLNNPTKGNGRNSEFLIVAAEDSTLIAITPSKITDKLRPKDSTFTVTLNRGQIFQVQSENEVNTGDQGQGDLTGSFINSSKPIAFYSGSLSTRVPTGKCCWDHLYEQIPPIHTWGREYYAVPLKSREQDRYRIMAAYDNTTVYISGLDPFSLNKGEFKELVFYHNDPKKIYGDQPIMVAQFSQSRDVDNNYTNGNGDPFMIILSSTTQTKNDVTFVAYNSDQIARYYVNIVTLTEEVNNIRFDGNSIAGEFQPFPDSDYSFAQKEISTGTHQIVNTNKNRGFLAYVYGYGGVESYGYGVGFNLDLVLDLGKSIDFNGDTLLLCNGDSRILDAGPYFDTYTWNTGDQTQRMEVTTGGKYQVKTTTIDGCELEDSIFVYVSAPDVDLKIDSDEGCSPYSIELNATNEFMKYLWKNENNDTLSTSQTIMADKTSEYRLTVWDKFNCTDKDTFKLVVFPVPDIDLRGEHLLCNTKQCDLSVDISGTPDYVWNYNNSFTWSSNDPGVKITNTSHRQASIDAPDWGQYEIYYQLTTVDGCSVKDTFEIGFYPTPTSEFIFVDDPNDKCKGYSREVKYTGNASENALYFWDYGGAKLIDSLDWNHFIVSVGAYNTNPYLTLFVEENGCWSDTTSSLLGANPDFVLETPRSRGCDSLTVSFKGELKVEDALSFEWDFGDGSPTSNMQAVEHLYQNPGFYDVSLLITNSLSGCQIGFQIDSMIKVFPTPTAEIIADTTTCHPDSTQIIYVNSIDSSLCFWSFEGAHQSGPGNDTITMILDEPFGKAILHVNEFGCVSQPTDLTLKRKPKFDISTFDEEGCQPFSTEIRTTSQDNYINYTWLTDTLPYLTGNSRLYYFPDSGRFDVSVMALSQETGCRDTLKKEDWIWIHPKPVAAFEVDYPIALLEHSTITYSNYSESADFYSWDFGDETSSVEENPVHTFTNLGEFVTQLIIESKFGCKDTTDFSIKILPFTVFTPNAFRPDSEISENRTFMPVGLGADENNFNLKIFDRWGQLVFESHSPNAPWDGSSRKGGKAPMGNYIWIAHYKDIQGFDHEPKGQVLLIR